MSDLQAHRVSALVDAVAAYPQLITGPASAKIVQPAGDGETP
ncbi:MAG: hypothetical protein ACRDRR_20385 [Pseudonocardiaceae bacterium]